MKDRPSRKLVRVHVRRPGPHNKSLRHGDEGKTSYVPTLTKSEQTLDPVSTPSFSLPLAGEQLGRGFILHPSPQRSSLGPWNKNEDPETVHRVAFNETRAPR